MDLRWIERIGNGPGYRVKVLQQRWEQRWGQDIGGEEWRDVPFVDETCEGCRRGYSKNESGQHVWPSGIGGGDFRECSGKSGEGVG